MAKRAKRCDPDLWDQVKGEITAGDKGGEPGQWSARKAQMAVQAYKTRGGRYEGEKSDDNALQAWTDERWGTRSGARSRDTGERYLPETARESLSDEEYDATTEKKRRDSSRGKQFSGQPPEIRDKTAKHRHGGRSDEPTKAELYETARKRGVAGRSRMTKDELRQAVG